MWSLNFPRTTKFSDERDVTTLVSLASTVAHTKEVSSIVISPDEKMIATSSADKTAKVRMTQLVQIIHILDMVYRYK